MGQILSITKRLAARAEIEGAIRALADHSNFIAAELLASAAIDVIGGVCREAGVETMTSRIFDMVKADKWNDVRKILRHPYNFLKHSDRDHSTAIDRYDTDAALWRVFWAITDYENCWKAKTFPMMVYLSWFLARHPGIVADAAKHIAQGFPKVFGDVERTTQSEALEKLRLAVRQYDELATDLANHPQFKAEHIER